MWKTVKLGDACLARRGTTITKKNAVEGDVPVIGGGTKPTYFHNEPNRAAGCITISGSGASAGFVNRWDMPIFASDCSTVEPKDEMQLPKFLYYYLLSQQQFIYDNFRSGAAQPHVYAKDIETLDFPILPLAEQERIVAKLDAAFAEIEASIKGCTSQRDSVKLLVNQYLATVSAEKIKLDDLIQIKTGKLDANAMVEGGKYPFFTCSKQIFEINDYAFDCDAVLLAGNNASGDFNVKHYHGKFNAYQRTYVLTVKDENTLRSRYLYFQLIQSLVQLKKMSVGANTKFLKIGMIKEFQIPLPEIEKQNFVLDKLENLKAQTKSLEENFDAQIDNLTALKSAILAQELQSSEAA